MKKHICIFSMLISLFAAQHANAQTRPSQIDLRIFAPTPLVQEEASAVSWACAYQALTITYCKQHHISHPETNNYSFAPAFLYNQVVKECSQGTTFDAILDLLKNKGVCFYDQFHPISCKEQPSEANVKVANDYKIAGYQSLFSKNISNQDKINNTLRALADSLPVMVGMNIDKGFIGIKEGVNTWTRDTTEYLGISKHAMTLVGYDDNKKAFLLMNSWGVKWGEGGYLWISYSDFAESASAAFVFTPQNYPAPARLSDTKTQEILKNAIQKIVSLSSLPSSLNITPKEALVMKLETGTENEQNFLYYNRVFINHLHEKFGTSAISFYVAKEIAHLSQNKEDKNFESDEFAGKTLAKMGENLAKTLEIMQDSFTEQSPYIQQQRTEAVKRGWNQGRK